MSQVFEKWDLKEIKIEDLGLINYICLDETLVPHTLGRHVRRQFAKSKVSIVERLMNKIMRTERNSGKKNKAYNIVKESFEIINKRTKQNPIQVLVKAVENTSPREETTRIKYGGIGYQVAVDIAPQRRVDLSLGFLTRGTLQSAFKNKRSVAECLADELILASEHDTRSFAIGKKEEKERVARAAH
ncbi:MAG: 30S ribosomal protein S7 [Methanobrevibacter arboriphilus]|jgi:small subunit ribosomal protein S7|uniref:Small ribosomal subunit protein uS7 n=2 Tax=Methanobrevibacter arboriphilus TaxID=39441 RepID=A0A843AK31_METAZ|nr:30S ribosomal protein S7 [Methanobrevibacter arboriphilus]MBF4469586.1 30S ribosomal protein S7 [Methanobrevibacter arboriphilus]MCC7562229.1 30S ribosomal protein S7 [Methanobrevibacter arboriphilus]BBL62685.1 30S ribosomal protein S7 [Methanobrevibacter arboriphilus]GLI11924.1 30S ribosomal protein S7 [Methanobrevibacter arboriphilus]